MYNPVMVEMVSREKSQRLQAELAGYQAINQAEREEKGSSQNNQTQTGVIRLARRFFTLFGRKGPASSAITDCN
jgi:hypothetical protein